MRTPTLLAALLAASALAPLAVAHLSHGGCSSATVVTGAVHVDQYVGVCRGVTVSTPLAECHGIDVHPARNLHVLVLWGATCQTGVVLSFLREDGSAAPLLA